MTNSNPSEERQSVVLSADEATATTLEFSPNELQEQSLALKQEVEQLYSKIQRLQNLIQTLVRGLVLAMLLTIGMSGWYAYRHLIQERIIERQTAQALNREAEVEAQFQELSAQLQKQGQQLAELRQSQQAVPDELQTLTASVQSHQRQLTLLRDRLTELEPETTNTDVNDEPASTRND